MSFLKRFITGLLLAGASIAVMAQEPVTTNRATDLRASPDDSARVIQSLPVKTEVRVVLRQGAWQQVRVGSNTGWLRRLRWRQ